MTRLREVGLNKMNNSWAMLRRIFNQKVQLQPVYRNPAIAVSAAVSQTLVFTLGKVGGDV